MINEMSRQALCALGAYLLLANLIGLWLMGFDKRRAARRDARRVPENLFFLTAMLGGSVGATLGMFLFRHKTRHWYFVWGLPLLLLAQVLLAARLLLPPG